MIPDPTEEIKAIRHRLGAELGFDLQRIIEEIRKRQKESKRHYIRLPKRLPQSEVPLLETSPNTSINLIKP